MRRVTLTTRITAAVATAAVVVALAACGSPSDLSERERMDRQAELAARPASETVVSRYEQMQQRIRDRLDSEIGPFAWKTFHSGGESTCGTDFPNMGGRNVALPLWGFDGNLPDTDWPRAQQIFTEITAEYGFVSAGLQIDQPGRHRISGVDTRLGAHYDFGTQDNTTMQITTGCHPPAGGGPA